MQVENQGAREALAPTGQLRAAIAVGSASSAVWATRDAESGKPRGVTVGIAEEVAARIGAPLVLIEFASSGKIIEAADAGQWNIGFAPVDTERKKVVDFGPNYFLGESTYMVPDGSRIATIEDVDQVGVRVVGVEDTATIRSSRKTLTRTTAVGVAELDRALAMFRSGEVDALALGRESLQSILSQFPGARMLDGHFHAAGVAVAVPKGNVRALNAVSHLLEEMKRDGTLRRIFDTHDMTNAAVAPLGSYS
jgi:polar amino acid transport system substrate-binding protein